jgi:hypothetical protein
LPLHRLNEPPGNELEDLIHNRLELTRYLCDLGPALHRSPDGNIGWSTGNCRYPSAEHRVSGDQPNFLRELVIPDP